MLTQTRLSGPTVPAPSSFRNPHVQRASSIAETVAGAERRIWNAWSMIQETLQHAGPHTALPAKLVSAYQAATDVHRAASRTWLEARQQVPRSQLTDPDATPVFPPTLLHVETGSELVTDRGHAAAARRSGFGAATAARAIPASSLLVKFGPQGNETIQTLSGAYVDSPFPPGSGLGFDPISGLIVLIALTIITIGVVEYFTHRDDGVIASANSLGVQADARSREAETQAAAFKATYAQCVAGTAPDSPLRAQCAASVGKSITDIMTNLPTIQSPGGGGFGWLEVAGIVGVVGVVGTVGYLIFHRRSQAVLLPRAAELGKRRSRGR